MELAAQPGASGLVRRALPSASRHAVDRFAVPAATLPCGRRSDARWSPGNRYAARCASGVCRIHLARSRFATAFKPVYDLVGRSPLRSAAIGIQRQGNFA
jgi:hypothetical protein